MASHEDTEHLPSPSREDLESGQRRWWERKRVLLPATAFGGLLVGVILGGVASNDPTELEAARAAVAEAEETAAGEAARADDAEGVIEEFEEQVAGLEETLGEREDEIEALERSVEDALDTARDELRDERGSAMAEIEQEREAVMADLEERSAELDSREQALDERAAELDVAEERQTARTFGNGIHVVGEDIEPGIYRTEGGSNCYWARLSGLGGGFGDLIANGLPDGPASVEIRSSDVAFESSGCSEWTRN